MERHSSDAERAPARITGWDRAVIVLLAAAACALSYDALRQMAVASHVTPALTYVFPTVVDGFIIYGVRGLLVMRDASFLARAYVWVLFSTATAASIWANALRAVRLNEQDALGTGLRLGDTTVGALSTIAPLALAGAVHLYILIARHAATPARLTGLAGPAGQVLLERADQTGHPAVPAVGDPATPADRLAESPGHLTAAAAGNPSEDASATVSPTRLTGESVTDRSVGHRKAVSSGRPVTSPAVSGQESAEGVSGSMMAGQEVRAARPVHVDEQAGQAVSNLGHVGRPVSDRADGPLAVAAPDQADREHGSAVMTGQLVGHLAEPTGSEAVSSVSESATDERQAVRDAPGDEPRGQEGQRRPVGQDLLPLARSAVAEAGRTSRAVVATAIRSQGMTLSSDRLTELMRRLREEPLDSQPPAS